MTNKEREEAIDNLLAYADWHRRWEFGEGLLSPEIDDPGFSSDTERMALRAVVNETKFLIKETWVLLLEAAALLQDGWNPGDKVVRK